MMIMGLPESEALLNTLSRLILIIAEIALIAAIWKYDLNEENVPKARMGVALLMSAIMIVVAHTLRLVDELFPGMGMGMDPARVILNFSFFTQAVVFIRVVVDANCEIESKKHHETG